MMRRRGGMGLIGAAATTAVVAGTAGAVRHRQEQKYAGQAAAQQQASQQDEMAQQLAQQQAQLDAMSAQQAPAPAPAPAAAPAGKSMDQKMAELTQLGQLRDAGILTQAEFEAQKAAILAS